MWAVACIGEQETWLGRSPINRLRADQNYARPPTAMDRGSVLPYLCGPQPITMTFSPDLSPRAVAQLCAEASQEMLIPASQPHKRARSRQRGHPQSCTSQLIRAGGGTAGNSPEKPAAVEEARDPDRHAIDEADIAAD